MKKGHCLTQEQGLERSLLFQRSVWILVFTLSNSQPAPGDPRTPYLCGHQQLHTKINTNTHFFYSINLKVEIEMIWNEADKYRGNTVTRNSQHTLPAVLKMYSHVLHR